ncbi:hypothetical protein RFN57_15535 [Streptomyces violaceochromogenes]|uniref:Major facilitator superfamily (MFS) profile domain-containing protein n=1 Tax=Streptomyces violaceochromogenes TaxID=67377 RepID=A0ABU6LYJ0_9ACTN|nr:hypothetical protein [Streptomyces violaceochromogenes]MEC7053692.1 hypothetical protein [Streptomyces violaceochromogenes]GHC60423.1 hypothetical protein GCM10010309_21250 [Streptomyces violaceochromogenes]
MNVTGAGRAGKPTRAFGLSYTAMAVAGTASVFTGRLADRWGSRPVFVQGALPYAAGVALRGGPAARSTCGSR